MKKAIWIFMIFILGTGFGYAWRMLAIKETRAYLNETLTESMIYKSQADRRLMALGEKISIKTIEVRRRK